MLLISIRGLEIVRPLRGKVLNNSIGLLSRGVGLQGSLLPIGRIEEEVYRDSGRVEGVKDMDVSSHIRSATIKLLANGFSRYSPGRSGMPKSHTQSHDSSRVGADCTQVTTWRQL